MSRQAIEHRLESLSVGHLTTINGFVVIRWSAESFEVGTFGVSSVGMDKVVEIVKGN